MRRTIHIPPSRVLGAPHVLLMGLAVGGATVLVVVILALVYRIYLSWPELLWTAYAAPVVAVAILHRRLHWPRVLTLHAGHFCGFVGGIALYWWRVGYQRRSVLAIDWLWTATGLALAISVATFLLVRGWGPRIVVDPRRCANCSYYLMGNRSGLCSECGTPIPADSTGPALEGTIRQESSAASADGQSTG